MSEQEPGIHTEITINAPVSRVWEILTAFDRYPEWNPTLEYIAGTASVGSPVRVRAGKGTPAMRDFDGTITEVNPPRLLASEGGDPTLFFGRHRWELSPEGAGTRLVNRETFTGEMVTAVLTENREAVKAEFTAFNTALKTAAEH